MRDFELSRNGQANAVTSVMSVKDWAFIRLTLRRSAPRGGTAIGAYVLLFAHCFSRLING